MVLVLLNDNNPEYIIIIVTIAFMHPSVYFTSLYKNMIILKS